MRRQGPVHHWQIVAGVCVVPRVSSQYRHAAKRPPPHRQAFGRVWRRAARAAGIPDGTGLHLLRDFYASLLIRYGESVKTVQARLGHATAAETLDTYSHLWPGSDDRTREAVDSAARRRLSQACGLPAD